MPPKLPEQIARTGRAVHKATEKAEVRDLAEARALLAGLRRPRPPGGRHRKPSPWANLSLTLRRSKVFVPPTHPAVGELGWPAR